MRSRRSQFLSLLIALCARAVNSADLSLLVIIFYVSWLNDWCCDAPIHLLLYGILVDNAWCVCVYFISPCACEAKQLKLKTRGVSAQQFKSQQHQIIINSAFLPYRNIEQLICHREAFFFWKWNLQNSYIGGSVFFISLLVYRILKLVFMKPGKLMVPSLKLLKLSQLSVWRSVS